MKAEKKESAAPTQKIKYSFIKIMTGSDLSRRRLPLMEAKASSPGPVVWLTACIHGDEVGGIVIIQDIFKRFRKGKLLRGAIYAFPLMNPIGFESGSRHVTLSMEDLNRSFPGNKGGSLAERIADKIFTTIKETRPTLVLDLHNDWIKSIPYTVIDPNPHGAQNDAYEITKDLSQKTGFPLVLDTDELKKSISYSLLQQGIPSLTLELGESYVVNERNIEYGVKSVWNILSYLGMIEPIEEAFVHPISKNFGSKMLKYSPEPLSSSSGVIRFLVKPGDVVKKGQPVAKIYNAFGKLLETVVAKNNAIVLAHSDSSVSYPGGPVMSFGVL